MVAEKRSVGAVVRYEDRVLIGKKLRGSPKKLAGKWHLPGERVEGEETDTEALLRCLAEECGLAIRVGRYIAQDVTPTSGSVIRWYECFASGDTLTIGSDLESAAWVTLSEARAILAERYATWPQALRDYFDVV